MINKILLTSAGRYLEKSSSFLGIEGENKANTLLFEFSDGFIDGLGQLYIERGSDIGYVNLIKNENSYELPIMSSLLSKVGEVNMQVVITKADGTIIKYDKFTMLVKDAIDTDIPLPEEYPSWTSTISEMLSKTQDAIDEANTISEQLLKDKEDGVFNGKDGANGKDGKDGFSPIATVTQTDTGATISITDTNGTTISTVKNGKDGSSGILEETDPVYSSEKSTLALKSELPTKLSQLQNDSEFITKTVNNLTNYYAKTETYTKTEINNLIGGLGSLDLEIVQSLPTVGKENTFYLLAQDREAPDIYDEYLYINGWEKIGNTKVDLTNYYTKSEVDNLIPVVPTKVSELENDSGYLTEYTETDPTIPTHVKNITQENITNWNNKSEFSGSYNDLTDKPTIPSVEGLATTEQLTQGLAIKQDKLTAGDNISIIDNVISASGTGGGTDSNPVGTIISFMGTIAPDGYLTCDGTVLNVADYPRLASHFETQFGSKNYFGGDGTTTFAVPDLRNEFLRGYGELSNEIGIHQDGTEHPKWFTWNSSTSKSVLIYNLRNKDYEGYNQPLNIDSTVPAPIENTRICLENNLNIVTHTPNPDGSPAYTSRPTNVAVLYCIKY